MRKGNIPDLMGQRFGRWLVIGGCREKTKYERQWLCRCDCGTERYVLERSLKAGKSLSCGCLRRENISAAHAYDLNGRVFGDLTVLRRSTKAHKNGGIWWVCRCSCGQEVEYTSTQLINGRRTCCGCKVEKKYYSVDITGQRFHRLVALYPLESRYTNGSVIWRCKCDCGNEIEVAYNHLVYGNLRSCGCQKKEHDKKLPGFLTHIDGTSLEAVKSKKIPTDNTTGYKGVYLIKGKYVAKIVFQKKHYWLGTYDDIEEAAAARQRAEEVLFDGFADYYERYAVIAAQNAGWAAENPIKIKVFKDGTNIEAIFSPSLNNIEDYLSERVSQM